MSNELITFIYEELCRFGNCTSRTDFSTDWLGQNSAYYRSIAARGDAISVQAQAYLAAALRNIGMCFVKSDFAQLRDKGAVMLDMHQRVLEDMFVRVTLDAVSF